MRAAKPGGREGVRSMLSQFSIRGSKEVGRGEGEEQGGQYLCSQGKDMTLVLHHNDLAAQFLGQSQ